MKRLIIAVIILAGVAVVSILSLNVQLSNTEYLLGELEEIQQAYDEGNRELCLTLSTEFVKTFESRTRIFPLFMRHADIGAIRESVAPLPVMLRRGMTDTSPAQLEILPYPLETLYESETPTLQNIL